ncbi:MAG: o-succinylbenzoate synthase [Chloroflexota bacterium]|nr:MAG: o-succinylbenzoate synthase [Chloroflexota bacterium]
MKIERIELHHVSQPLVAPFRTSFGTQVTRPCILVAVYSEGLAGWGECVAADDPGYSYETVQTAWHILSDFLIPSILGQTVTTAQEVTARYQWVRGHPMAKAGLENAVWDLLAQAAGVSLSKLLGGVRQRVEVGVSIGIQPTLEAQLERVDQFVQQGYRRIKMKIEPGWELTPLTAVRERYPTLKLMADANSAFTLADAPLFREMDALNLLMIEQPLHYDDIADHAKLQRQLQTPICLDESIHSPLHARWAIEIKAGRIINMKVGRVGGLSNALAIHEMCLEAGIPLWCGGMLETGVGRAFNLHLATLPNFTLPGDISATHRYYHEDIAEPDFNLNIADSTITVPTGPGIGVRILPERLEKVRVSLRVFQA